MNQERQEIPRAEWRPFFETVTKDFQGSPVSVEVLSGEYGDQMEADRQSLAYIEYDEHDDTFSVAVAKGDESGDIEVRHMVRNPRTIYADPTMADIPWTFDVVADDGTQSIITLQLRAALKGR